MTPAEKEERRTRCLLQLFKEGGALTFEEIYSRRGLTPMWPEGFKGDAKLSGETVGADTLRRRLKRQLEKMEDRRLLQTVEELEEGRETRYKVTPEGRRLAPSVDQRPVNLMLGMLVCRVLLERILPSSRMGEIRDYLGIADEEFQALEKKFVASGRSKKAKNPKALAEAIRIVPHDLAEEPAIEVSDEVLKPIFKSIQRSVHLKIAYRSKRSRRSGSAEYRVRPFGLVLKGLRLYLLGEVNKDDRSVQRRAWRLHGITNAECTEETFPTLDGFSLDDYLREARPLENPVSPGRGGPISIELEIYPDQLGESKATVLDHLGELRINGKRIDSALRSERDAMILAFEHPDTEELRRWILGFTPSVVVRKPDWLRSALTEKLRESLDRFDRDEVRGGPAN